MGDRHILTYISFSLDPVEAKQPPCARYAAGLTKVIFKTDHIVMDHPHTILTSHSATSFVESQAFTLSASRAEKINQVLHKPSITYKTEGINSGDGFQDGEPHKCANTVMVDN